MPREQTALPDHELLTMAQQRIAVEAATQAGQAAREALQQSPAVTAPAAAGAIVALAVVQGWQQACAALTGRS